MKKVNLSSFVGGPLAFFLFMMAISLPVFSAEAKQAATADEGMVRLEEKWGIKPLTIRLTGADHFLDFRFLVLDSEKAKPVLERGKKAYLMDQGSGKVFNVPVTKLGPLRGTTVKPKEGKQYIILFGNSDKSIHRGSRVSVIIGEFKAENLMVQ